MPVFHCTDCNVALGARVRRKLPDKCPVCDNRTPPMTGPGSNWYREVES